MSAFCEEPEYNLPCRWFLDMDLMERSFNATVFTKNRQPLMDHDVDRALFNEVIWAADGEGLLSDEHFSMSQDRKSGSNDGLVGVPFDRAQSCASTLVKSRGVLEIGDMSTAHKLRQGLLQPPAIPLGGLKPPPLRGQA